MWLVGHHLNQKKQIRIGILQQVCLSEHAPCLAKDIQGGSGSRSNGLLQASQLKEINMKPLLRETWCCSPTNSTDKIGTIGNTQGVNASSTPNTKKSKVISSNPLADNKLLQQLNLILCRQKYRRIVCKLKSR